MLEAGAKITPKDFTEHIAVRGRLPYLGQSPIISRDRPIQSLCYACRESNQQWFVNDFENPYTQAKPFHWIRERVLGGRSLSWGRQTYRMSDLDFKAASHDGYGEDWPISYDEMVPYYEIVEKYVGISGQSEGLSQLPDSVFLPPMEMTCGEQILRDQVREKMGRVITIGRAAILTQTHNGRAACHYCGPCEQGCVTFSYFSSPWTTIADAQRTGKFTLICDAVAAQIPTKDGKATGVMYIDRVTREPKEIRASVVVLCASTLESTRLLLNSNICNQNDALGHYVMDHHYQGGAAGVHADARSEAVGRSAAAAERDLRSAFPQRDGEDDQRIHSRLRISGRQLAIVRHGRPRIRRRLTRPLCATGIGTSASARFANA